MCFVYLTPTPKDLPHVNVTESAKMWEIILRTTYSMPSPIIASLEDLEPFFLAAKYECSSLSIRTKGAFKTASFYCETPYISIPSPAPVSSKTR